MSQQPETDEDVYGFIFLFEYKDELYTSLDKIRPKDGDKVIIHPVYYTNYDNTMTSESVTWSEREKKYVTSSEEGSWLDTMKEFPRLIYPMELDEVVHHEDEYFHCDGCLLHYHVGDVFKVPIKQ